MYAYYLRCCGSIKAVTKDTLQYNAPRLVVEDKKEKYKAQLYCIGYWK
jgi:hypothetical protein